MWHTGAADFIKRSHIILTSCVQFDADTWDLGCCRTCMFAYSSAQKEMHATGKKMKLEIEEKLADFLAASSHTYKWMTATIFVNQQILKAPPLATIKQAEPTDKMSNAVANLGDQPHESLKKGFPEMKNLELGLTSNTMSPCESRQRKMQRSSGREESTRFNRICEKGCQQ